VQKIFSYLWTVFLILFMLSMVMMSYVLYNGFQSKSSNDISKPKSIYSKLLWEVRTNGWNDSNESFTQFVIENGERVFNETHNLANSNEYNELLAYVKYLEFKGRHNKASAIYVDIFKDFQKIERSWFNVSSQITIETVVCKQIEDNFKNNIFSKEIKDLLKKELQSLLIVDKTSFFKAIKYEFDFALKNRQELRKNLLGKSQLNKSQKKMLKIKFDYTDEYIHESYLKLNEVAKVSSLVELHKYAEKKKAEMYDFLKDKETRKKLQNDFNVSPSQSNSLKLVKLQAKVTALVVSSALYGYLFSDHLKYLERIEKNKILLKEL